MARYPIVNTLVQSVWLKKSRRPMADSLVQCAWLQMARKYGGLLCAVHMETEGHRPHCGLPSAVGVSRSLLVVTHVKWAWHKMVENPVADSHVQLA